MERIDGDGIGGDGITHDDGGDSDSSGSET